MKIDLRDMAACPPVEPESAQKSVWAKWWRWWTDVFYPQPIACSGRRAHVENLCLVYYRPGESPDIEKFNTFDDPDSWLTDAKRIVIIGNLWVYVYSDAMPKVLENPYGRILEDKDDLDHSRLLAENIREYGGQK